MYTRKEYNSELQLMQRKYAVAVTMNDTTFRSNTFEIYWDAGSIMPLYYGIKYRLLLLVVYSDNFNGNGLSYT